jgi:5-hydroxyisourate hydrolase-like protein (transthyretin family)
LLLVLFFLFGEASAVTGRVKGTIRDDSGEHIAGVPVRLYAIDGGQKRVFVTHTDSDGRFRFETLTAGTYELEVGGEKFAVQKKESIVVRPPFRNVIDFSMQARPDGSPGAFRLAWGLNGPETPADPSGAATGIPTSGSPNPLQGPARVAVGFNRELQTIKGSIAGDLKDKDGVGVPDARIILQGADRSYRSISKAGGDFRIADVPVGRYNLEVRSPGYLTVFLPGVTLESAAELDFQLTLIDYPLDYREEVGDLLPPEQPLSPLP